MNIAVLGAGYVGLVSGACLAAKGHRVCLHDINADVVEAINKAIPPIYEKGLEELLSEVVGNGNLKAIYGDEFEGDYNLVLICVGTPSTDGKINLNAMQSAIKGLGKWLRNQTKFISFVVKSTVLPGTVDTFVKHHLETCSGKLHQKGGFGLGMNPEFLREGSAVSDFNFPDRVVIGFEDDITRKRLRELYKPWKCEKIEVNARTAEMIKYSNNALLALQISAANELANIAVAAGGINFRDVLMGIRSDQRWSPLAKRAGEKIYPKILTYLEPGCGFGGSCFPKDVQALRTFAQEREIEPLMLQSILDVNDKQPLAVLESFERKMREQGHKTILLLGMAFKPGTDDIRESASLKIADELLEKKYKIISHDPKAGSVVRQYYEGTDVTVVEDWKNHLDVAEGIIICTKWEEYLELKTPEIIGRLEGKVLLDPRAMFDLETFPGVYYYAAGLGKKIR